MNTVTVRTDVLVRVLDFVADFHGDDLPENAPGITADVIALFDSVKGSFPEIAERQIKVLSEPIDVAT